MSEPPRFERPESEPPGSERARADLPLSELPRESAYWDGLAATVRADAAGPLAGYAARAAPAAATGTGAADSWYGVVAGRAGWLLAASIVAMLVLWTLLPPRGSTTAFRWMERSVAPREAAGSLVSGTAPPAVEELLVQFPPASELPEEQR